MLNTSSKRPIRILLPYRIPSMGVPDNSYCVPFMPVSTSGFARIMV